MGKSEATFIYITDLITVSHICNAKSRFIINHHLEIMEILDGYEMNRRIASNIIFVLESVSESRRLPCYFSLFDKCRKHIEVFCGPGLQESTYDEHGVELLAVATHFPSELVRMERFRQDVVNMDLFALFDYSEEMISLVIKRCRYLIEKHTSFWEASSFQDLQHLLSDHLLICPDEQDIVASSQGVS